MARTPTFRGGFDDEPEDEAPIPRRRPAPRPAPRRPDRRRGGGIGFFSVITLVLAIGAAACCGLAAWLAVDLPDLADVKGQPRRPSVAFIDVAGREIARRGPVVAEPVRLDELPPYLVDAVIAVEDRRFFSHWGVDPIGLGRAAVQNVKSMRVVEGGSTLTQQLAKNLFLDGRRTLKRKGQEAVLALLLEQRFTKAEILELYLNRVYFGAGAWGVEAAAQRYFGKSARDVSIGEAALLAGLLKAPSRYSPTSDVARAETRATIVLDVMAETGKITPAERDAAFAAPVRVKAAANPAQAGYFIDWIATEARALAQSNGDLIVETTLDLDMQAAAEAAVAKVMDAESETRNAGQAALIAFDGDGAVRAMVGGRDYKESQYNRALQAKRQPGSAFKPFVYAAALEAGLSPLDVREDAPLKLGDWEPSNYKNEYLGLVSLQLALERSINTVAVRVTEEIGRDHVVRTARRMGLEAKLTENRSMALGSDEVTLDDLARAYAAFANGGWRVDPYAIRRIRDLEGRVLWERASPRAARALDEAVRIQMNDMLARVVENGTGRGARLAGREAAGKTGTTNDFRDAWFLGYVPGFSAGVWVGNDDFSPMNRVTGGTLPARIWKAFMTDALKDMPAATLDRWTPSAPPTMAAAAPESDPGAKPDPGAKSDEERAALDDLMAGLAAGGW